MVVFILVDTCETMKNTLKHKEFGIISINAAGPKWVAGLEVEAPPLFDAFNGT
jgi:hypothetical protein